MTLDLAWHNDRSLGKEEHPERWTMRVGRFSCWLPCSRRRAAALKRVARPVVVRSSDFRIDSRALGCSGRSSRLTDRSVGRARWRTMLQSGEAPPPFQQPPAPALPMPIPQPPRAPPACCAAARTNTAIDASHCAPRRRPRASRQDEEERRLLTPACFPSPRGSMRFRYTH